MEDKKYKSGLFLGKYMPPHKGHLSVIMLGSLNCEKFTVLACSLKNEPIPGELRAQWVNQFCQESYFTNTKVIAITDELPQFPEEHIDFWTIWCDLIKKHCPDIDVIYSSEDYGFELAKRLNIPHELVDKERKKVPVSGTAIRTIFQLSHRTTD